ncbi:sigma-70 family RNA polymerase sigma factor [Nannocystis sp. ILAH1]|uniref:sigma-70 family RNA polymerase sigma factor n=1 Tax=unclassified Nannocystis TaxID=2627009 RepID=UPI00226E6D02|nr:MULTISPECIES: sigma-70 family RNA polymerase sigma factor [unclassified Nannocystis]MCY0986729.1 sigma-70 family RNA polymerase sigma factor [Nannocystis sp. ILAH1]MCY1071608.1 sigma-70 family RNA polymerase sigma factor [Nannocystis sp. RBIL2]
MNDVASPHATANDLEQHRAALTGHCYRMLGSAAEADDAVQDTLVRAWRALDRFEGRSSLRTWLYRIATRVCLDALSRRSRRARPMELGPMGTIDDALVSLPGEQWVEPIPDFHALPADADPYERASLRESIRLAFVAALQHLPPKQRAVLLLTEVLGWPAAEVAGSLETSVAAVNSALQRARATLASRGVGTGRASLSASQSQLLERFVDAFERYDMDALSSLLHQDATLSMPPFSLWLRGLPTIRAWLSGRGAGCRGSRLVPTAASGSLAFGQYRPNPEGGHAAWALIVLETAGEQIVGLNSFLDTAALFPRFGLPPALDP